MEHVYRREEHTSGMIQKGFTLIELMIGIVIIGLIVGGGAYFFMGYLESARRSNTKTTIEGLKTNLMLYKNEKGDYPKQLQDLLKGGFLGKAKALPKDAWDRAFVYRPTPDGKNPYELYSYGPKGKSGGKESRISAW